MGKSPCCDKDGLKKGPWTPEEDEKLLAYVEQHGHGGWRSLPAKAGIHISDQSCHRDGKTFGYLIRTLLIVLGLERCGKSCRLRWINYLRPDIKRGKFSLQEEQTIIQLHALLGNRWSAIATHLPKRTDNEIKNHWNTHLKKRLTKMGIDPVTHKLKNENLLMSNDLSKNAAELSHMAQWESARLEAEARLVREARLRSYSVRFPQTTWTYTSNHENAMEFIKCPSDHIVTKTTSCVTFRQENGVHSTVSASDPSGRNKPDFGDHEKDGNKDENSSEGYKGVLDISLEFGSDHVDDIIAGEEGFVDLPLKESLDRSLTGDRKEYSDERCGNDYFEDNRNYWNNILDLVNSIPSDSKMF